MTLDEIAKELGVSKSTVSRALSGKGRIGENTRKRVLDFINNTQANNWEQNDPALVTHNLCVVLPEDVYKGGANFFQNCLFGICEAALPLGYHIMITTTKEDDISALKSLVEEHKVDGVILTRTFEEDKVLQFLVEAKCPTAITGSCKFDNIIQVDADNKGAAEKMTSMLVGKGFRKFAFFIRDMNHSVDKERYNGFCKGLLKNGISSQNQIIYNGLVKMEFLDSIIDNVIANKVECIICGDDMLCTMIMSKLQAEGYQIPKDIAVASLYNSINLECYSPAVTAVSVSGTQMGNLAVKELIQHLNGKSFAWKTNVDYDIIFRKSTN